MLGRQRHATGELADRRAVERHERVGIFEVGDVHRAER